MNDDINKHEDEQNNIPKNVLLNQKEENKLYNQIAKDKNDYMHASNYMNIGEFKFSSNNDKYYNYFDIPIDELNSVYKNVLLNQNQIEIDKNLHDINPSNLDGDNNLNLQQNQNVINQQNTPSSNNSDNNILNHKTKRRKN